MRAYGMKRAYARCITRKMRRSGKIKVIVTVKNRRRGRYSSRRQIGDSIRENFESFC
jgi:hypothetical protein